MPPKAPIWLRLSGNTEKQFVQKLGRFFTGILFRANLFEAAPGLCSSLVVSLSEPTNRRSYALDPATYVFALDPNNEWSIRQWRKVARGEAESQLRSDLTLSNKEILNPAWIRNVLKPGKRDSNKVEIFGMKKAYRKVADKTLGRLRAKVGQKALTRSDLQEPAAIADLTAATIDYQLQAVKSKFSGEKYEAFLKLLRPPDLVFSPYFPIQDLDWLKVQASIWREFESQFRDPAATLVVNCRASFLVENVDVLEQTLTGLKSGNIALWIDKLDEETADLPTLQAQYRLVNSICSSGKTCINMFGGGFSAHLYALGAGAVLSCGYGEAKAVEPLLGGLPAAKYYIPNLQLRRSVAEAYDLIRRVGEAESPGDFLTKICGCAICKEAVKKRVSDFATFYGELGEPRQFGDDQVRRYPTGPALERCRFHYLLARLKEHQQLDSGDMQSNLRQLNRSINFWAPVANAIDHLARWRDALTPE